MRTESKQRTTRLISTSKSLDTITSNLLIDLQREISSDPRSTQHVVNNYIDNLIGMKTKSSVFIKLVFHLSKHHPDYFQKNVALYRMTANYAVAEKQELLLFLILEIQVDLEGDDSFYLIAKLMNDLCQLPVSFGHLLLHFYNTCQNKENTVFLLTKFTASLRTSYSSTQEMQKNIISFLSSLFSLIELPGCNTLFQLVADFLNGPNPTKLNLSKMLDYHISQIDHTKDYYLSRQPLFIKLSKAARHKKGLQVFSKLQEKPNLDITISELRAATLLVELMESDSPSPLKQPSKYNSLFSFDSTANDDTDDPVVKIQPKTTVARKIQKKRRKHKPTSETKTLPTEQKQKTNKISFTAGKANREFINPIKNFIEKHNLDPQTLAVRNRKFQLEAVNIPALSESGETAGLAATSKSRRGFCIEEGTVIGILIHNVISEEKAKEDKSSVYEHINSDGTTTFIRGNSDSLMNRTNHSANYANVYMEICLFDDKPYVIFRAAEDIKSLDGRPIQLLFDYGAGYQFSEKIKPIFLNPYNPFDTSQTLFDNNAEFYIGKPKSLRPVKKMLKKFGTSCEKFYITPLIKHILNHNITAIKNALNPDVHAKHAVNLPVIALAADGTPLPMPEQPYVTPLMFALYHLDFSQYTAYEIVAELLDFGACARIQMLTTGYSAIECFILSPNRHLLSTSNQKGILEMLRKNGLFLLRQILKDKTPFHLAAEHLDTKPIDTDFFDWLCGTCSDYELDSMHHERLLNFIDADNHDVLAASLAHNKYEFFARLLEEFVNAYLDRELYNPAVDIQFYDFTIINNIFKKMSFEEIEPYHRLIMQHAKQYPNSEFYAKLNKGCTRIYRQKYDGESKKTTGKLSKAKGLCLLTSGSIRKKPCASDQPMTTRQRSAKRLRTSPPQ